MSLQASDQEAAAHAVAPRVSLADIEAAIAARFDQTADVVTRVSKSWTIAEGFSGLELADQLAVLSLCIVVTKNGFTIIGKSAPASPANFNAELGRKMAYEDAIRQLWPLMGFALRDRLARGEH